MLAIKGNYSCVYYSVCICLAVVVYHVAKRSRWMSVLFSYIKNVLLENVMDRGGVGGEISEWGDKAHFFRFVYKKIEFKAKFMPKKTPTNHFV